MPMPGLIKKLLAAAALVLALAGAAPAATDIHINPMPPNFKPNWTQVPNAPGVYWAPNLPTDVFRYRGKYYFFWEGYLYRGSKPSGPWKSVIKAPAWFTQIDPAYFKTLRQPTATPPPEAATPETPAPSPTPPPWTPPAAPPGAAAPELSAPVPTPPAAAPPTPEAAPPAPPVATPSQEEAPAAPAAPAAPSGTPPPKVM
jgi:hypothetical protein